MFTPLFTLAFRKVDLQEMHLHASSVSAALCFARPSWAMCRGFVPISMTASPYDRSIKLTKPLGIVLEEAEGGGVLFAAFKEGGSAATCGLDIAPGDRLVRIGETDVSSRDFDSIMAMLAAAPSTLTLTVNDGLSRLDITPNLANSLPAEYATLADLVVRAAVREVRRIVGANEELKSTLGRLLRVELVIGAGVRPDGRCLVRFFGIFSTGGSSSTYSCNISATAIRRKGKAGDVEVVALSCAKDEGWGRTIDLKREPEERA